MKFNNVYLTEAINEPQIIKDLRWIVKHKQAKQIKDPISKKSVRVNLLTAIAITNIYDKISKRNQKQYVTVGIPKMKKVANDIIKDQKS